MRKDTLTGSLIAVVILGILAAIMVPLFRSQPAPEEIKKKVEQLVEDELGPEWLETKTGDLVIFPQTEKRKARYYIFLVATREYLLLKDSSYSTVGMLYSWVPDNAEIVDQDGPHFDERCPDHLK